MSLRVRLISLVWVVLLISLALGGVIAYSNASRSVRTEMRAALLVGRQAIEHAIERLPDARDPSRELDDLVASFKGNRHVRVWRLGEPSSPAPVASESASFGGAPAWFSRVVGVAPEADHIRIVAGGQDYGSIAIATDPHNEIFEVWNEFTDSLITPAVFCGLTILLIYFFVGRLLQPLNRLAAALEEVGGGCYRTRISGRLAPELSRLRDSFNRMAARLAETDADNRRLNKQLLTLQEQERCDLARDLHDEVSPYLFAINADAATASRLLREGRASEARAHVQSIADAVRHMQRQVRGMLGRLRPIGLAEFGLREAIENMVAFWRRRRPEIRFRVTVAAECDGLGGLVGTTICRIVQESLSNAVRHAEPKLIAVSVDARQSTDEVRVVVLDDGPGMREPNRLGYGLVGISERVEAVGGRLTFANNPGEGFAMTAVLPYRRAQDGVPSSPQAAES